MNGSPFSLWEKGWDEGLGRRLTFEPFAALVVFGFNPSDFFYLL
jgi:hypothetical protein